MSKSITFQNPGAKIPNAETIKVSLEIPARMSINVPKIGKVMVCDLTKLPEVSLAYLLKYGFRQQQDVHAGLKKGSDAKIVEALEERFGDLERGDIPKGSGRRSSLNPLQVAFIGIIRNSMEWSQEEYRDRAVKLGNGELTATDLVREYAVKKYGKAAAGKIAALEEGTWNLAKGIVERQAVTIE